MAKSNKATKNPMIMKNGLDQAASDAVKQNTAKNPLLCYEVWYEDDKQNRQMVAAYWDVMVAWRVMEAINKSVYGNLGVAEVCVASGMEQLLVTLTQGTTHIHQPRTDVLNEQGIRSQPNEAKYEAAKREFEQLDNDQAEPQWKPKPWATPSAGDMRELVNPEQDVSNTEPVDQTVELSCKFCLERTHWDMKQNPMTCNQCGYSSVEAEQKGPWNKK